MKIEINPEKFKKIAIRLFFAFLYTFAIYELWNMFLVQIFELKIITYFQAVGLCVFFYFIFKNPKDLIK